MLFLLSSLALHLETVFNIIELRESFFGGGIMGFFSGKKDRQIKNLLQENAALKKRNRELVNLRNEKDSFFSQMISDGLRHGSSLTSKHMSDPSVQ